MTPSHPNCLNVNLTACAPVRFTWPEGRQGDCVNLTACAVTVTGVTPVSSHIDWRQGDCGRGVNVTVAAPVSLTQSGAAASQLYYTGRVRLTASGGSRPPVAVMAACPLSSVLLRSAVAVPPAWWLSPSPDEGVANPSHFKTLGCYRDATGANSGCYRLGPMLLECYEVC